MNVRIATTITTFVWAFGSASVFAEGEGVFAFKGFGTISTSRTFTDSAGYVNAVQPAKAGRPNQWTFSPETLIGAQLDIAPKSDISATVQVIAKHRNTDQIQADVEWAFIKYQFNPSWRLRAGRVLTPAFMDSEYRYVGYANTYVRPAQEVYAQYPLSTHDGLDINYRASVGGGIVNLTGYAGTSRIDGPANPDGSLAFTYGSTDLKGIRAAWESESLSLSGGITRLTSAGISGGGTAPLLSVLAAAKVASTNFGATCPSCQNAVTALTTTMVDASGIFTVMDLGARYTMGDWAFWGEYATTRPNEALFRSANLFTLGASRTFGNFTPFVTVNRTTWLESGSNAAVSTAEIASIPSAPLRAALNAYNATVVPPDNSRHSVAVGTRWDLAKNIALKGELWRVSLDSPVNAPAFPMAAGVPRDTSFNVLTFAIDFVF